MTAVLFHDYTSPASAVAVARVERLAAAGVALDVEGVDVVGVALRLPPGLEVLAELARLAPQAEQEGITLRRPRALPPTVAAHAVEDLAREHGLAAAWRAAAYRALRADGRDLADPDVLAQLAASIGLDPVVASTAAADPVRLRTVRLRSLTRRREGVGGVPVLLAHRTLVPGLLTEQDLLALAS